MGKPTGFMENGREPIHRLPIGQRLKNSKEFYLSWTDQQASEQGGRCMDCSIPFCMNGCPLGNLIPDWNDLVYRGQWKEALQELHATNNFPEFTGRICPAPCEASCVLNINQDPVTIEHLEKSIADKGWEEGWIKPQPPEKRTGRKVVVVGSGPAGLAAAQQLNRCGHLVTVLERDEYIGGLLTLGIPDFKLSKDVVTRRIEQMTQEGITFMTGKYVGENYPTEKLLSDFDAVCLTIGSTVPRDLNVDGRDLHGVHFAMEYLTQQNRITMGQKIPSDKRITAKGKSVIILGGGDTGADCLGTAHRQGAAAVHQLELLEEPPKIRDSSNPWPEWPNILRVSAAHEEGGIRDYNILTKTLVGESASLKKLQAVRIKWGSPDKNGRSAMEEITDSDFEIQADLLLLAMGFLHPEPDGLLAELKVELDGRGNVKTDTNKMTTVPGVFAAGDMARGQSLVVWAIAEGRQAAYGIDKHLMGSTSLTQVLSTA